MRGFSTSVIAVSALIGLFVSPLSAQTLAAATASGGADAAAGVTSSQAKPDAAQKPEGNRQRVTRQAAARPAPEPAPADVFMNFFRGNTTPPARTQDTSPARLGSRDGSTAEIMTRRAVASYSTSSNALGFGLYRITPRETVDFREKHAPGTIIVRQREKRLYYVLGDGKAIRYAIAVGREGAAWAGTSTVSDKREWPSWTPTPNILRSQPDLPRFVEGGPHNPMGARALYLGQTLYRIHGTNEPWRIGEEASSGCIRLSNDDVIDLYNRTRLGATVIVIR